MLVERISDEEISMIDSYRKAYAFLENNCSTNGIFMPIREMLKVWEEAKSEYLYKLFGESLMIKKHLHFTKSFEELSEEIDCMMDGVSTYGRIHRNGCFFVDSFRSLLNSFDFRALLGERYCDITCELRKLIYAETLINGYYDGEDVNIPLPNGKTYKIHHGCKPMRALSKLADAFHLKNFEDFRICHSQILNQKDVGGELTLSIHPLDYMTMSDNDCGWDTCMSWCNEGGYRQGTVEMMNSKSVIVAYLSSEEPMNMYPGFWSNKRWRQLFVVDKNAILGVKAYPYQNDDLTQAVLEWLRELVKDNLGWIYGDISATHTTKDPIILPDNKEVHIRLLTGCMYNDWGCAEKHYVMFNMEVPLEDLHYRSYCSDYLYNLTYSGPSQCMVCGSVDVDFVDESYLTCAYCEDCRTCDCCGEYIYNDEYYVIDDQVICEACHDNYVSTCACCEDEHDRDGMHQIYVIVNWTEEEQEELQCRLVARGYKNWDNLPEIVSINAAFPQFYVCRETECVNGFCKTYLKEGCRPSEWVIGYNTYICVNWDDLTENAKEEVYYPVGSFKEDAFMEQRNFKAQFANKIEEL